VRTKNVVRPADTLIRLKVRVAGTGGWVAAVGGSDDECADGSHERPSLGRVKVGRVGPDEVELEDRLLLANGRMWRQCSADGRGSEGRGVNLWVAVGVRRRIDRDARDLGRVERDRLERLPTPSKLERQISAVDDGKAGRDGQSARRGPSLRPCAHQRL
jgi:hypothetical protein